MSYKVSLAALAITLLAACERSAPPPVDLAAEAQRITRESIIVDTHIDVPYRLAESAENVSEATERGDFDYPRARAGGLNAAFMSIYTPAELEAEGESRDAAEQLIELVENIVATSEGKFAIATSPAAVRAQFEAGVISLPMGMENGSRSTATSRPCSSSMSAAFVTSPSLTACRIIFRTRLSTTIDCGTDSANSASTSCVK